MANLVILFMTWLFTINSHVLFKFNLPNNVSWSLFMIPWSVRFQVPIKENVIPTPIIAVIELTEAKIYK